MTRVVKILLDKESNFIPQADRFGNTLLHYASAQSYWRVLEDKDNDRPWSPEFSQAQILGRLIERNPNNDRPWSLECYESKILERLIEANPYLAYVPNIYGDYPVFVAIRNQFGRAVDTKLDHCPESAELVNQEGQNALHLAVMEKNHSIIHCLAKRLESKKLINEPDNYGNTPMHLATLTNQHDIVWLLIYRGPPDLTVSNKEGLTAMDLCGYMIHQKQQTRGVDNRF
ncbi:hypothetical protein AAC387_Pa06g2180 [Persea americana]